MTRTYVDADAAAVRGAAQPTLDPAAIRSLRFLGEAGHDVIVVTDDAAAVPGEFREVAGELVSHVPARPPAPAWYLTTSVERCRGASAKLRTVLIGTASVPGSIHRCDSSARDLSAAVLEILASEAMPRR